MEMHVLENKKKLGEAAAKKAEELLSNAIDRNGSAAFIASTGASQFEFLETLTGSSMIDWQKTAMFHMDEYVGMSESHPASFCRYLKERLIDKVHPGAVYLIRGDADPEEECERISDIISRYSIDAAFVGIGENGHLAFNDPPADFETEKPCIVVKLDEKCRRPQFGEGWFKTLEDVPDKAVSLSIKQIMKSKTIICTIPDKRKAEAVKNCIEGEISPLFPASILRKHPQMFMFLDKDSSSLLAGKT